MGRCLICNERIRIGDLIIFEGQYPGRLRRFFFRWWYGLEFFGRVYHSGCYAKMHGPRASQPETIVKDGEIKKKCRKCGYEFSSTFNFCPYCGGDFEH